MWRWIILGIAILAFLVFGFSLADVASNGDVQASAVIGAADADISGFARATAPLDWQFPRDFAAHEDYQTEWWYYTGNIATAEGRRFGYQFTIFRRSITAEAATPESSEWRSNQLYMAHFAVSDVEGGRFFHDERFSRGGAGLAGAVYQPTYQTWLEDWRVSGLDDAARERRLTARMTYDGLPVAVDFTLSLVKPPALQGVNTDGLSAKSGEAGNASHYYSLTRMPTQGTITIGAETFSIDGYSWMDHEFSTSALGSGALGWDWFGLQFDDGREIMIGQIRLTDGGKDPNFGGLLVNADGSTRYLPSSAITITPTAAWTSPHTGAEYPAGWSIAVDTGAPIPLTFTLTPQLADQELHGGGIAYWEGTVRIDGDVSGYGYAELTGYVDALTGRF
ncbi:MAG: lipocalin-like domain-containing protein [bacterium]|nr:lipocalin-like domain-containing protein [bacterium]